VPLLTAAAWKYRPKPYDPKIWLGDYEELRGRIGRLYANLDWSAAKGGTDLRELHAETYHALVYARSDEEAGQVLRQFVRAFQDPHIGLRWAASPPLDPPPSREMLSRFTPAEKACADLGYRDGTGDFAFALDEKAGFRRLPGANSFPAALLDVGGRRFGLLRIGSFSERNYRGACLREWPRFRQTLPGTSEPSCQRDFSVSVSGRLLRELAWRARQVRHAEAGALLIDLTDNGGGHSWYRRAAELFAPGPVPPFRAALVKSAHTAESLQEDRQTVFHNFVRHRQSQRAG